jgi:hypothetical protein
LAAATSSRSRYSSPAPTICARSLSSRAIFPARRSARTSGRFEDDRLLPLRGRYERRRRSVPLRPRLAGRALRIRRFRIAPPDGVHEGLAHERHGAHLRSGIDQTREFREVAQALGLERDVLRGVARHDAPERSPSASETIAPAPRRIPPDGGTACNDGETEAAIGLGHPFLDVQVCDDAVGRPVRRGGHPSRAAAGTFRRLVVVLRALRFLSGEPVGRDVGIEIRRVNDLARNLLDAGVGGNPDVLREADRLDDAAAHHDDSRVEHPTRRRENTASRQREREAIAAPNFTRTR